jgi:hypothetical protein
VTTDERAVSRRPGSGTLDRAGARRDATVRRWDVLAPSATVIGRPASPEADLPESVRRLHEERHPATAGHGERMHRLDRLRIAHALCNRLPVTRWQRDRVLGIMHELDLTAFGSRRAIPTVALVVIRHVVDAERRRYLGLDDRERIRELDPGEMERLYDRFESLGDDDRFRALAERRDLDPASLNRLDRVLQEQLDEQELAGAALGRSRHRDRNLPHILEGD